MDMRLVGSSGWGWHQLPGGLLGAGAPGRLERERQVSHGGPGLAPGIPHVGPGQDRPAAGRGCSSSRPALPPTHQGSWSPRCPGRESCHQSSSPKVRCSRKPSRQGARGSPCCRPQEPLDLHKHCLSPAHWGLLAPILCLPQSPSLQPPFTPKLPALLSRVHQSLLTPAPIPLHNSQTLLTL